MTLTPSLRNEVIEELRVAFPDNKDLFESTPLIATLHQIMTDFVTMKFNIRKLKMFADRYFAKGRGKSEQEKSELECLRLIVATCCVLLLSKHECAKRLFKSASEMDSLFEIYSAADLSLFARTPMADVARFVQFHNMIHTAMLVAPPRLNKQLIVNIACRLQTPKPCIYTWGDGKSIELKRFVAIYHIESGVPVEKRDPRARSLTNAAKKPATPRTKRSIAQVSDSDSDEDEQAWKMDRTDTIGASVLLSAPSANPADYYMPDDLRLARESAQKVSLSDEVLRNIVPVGEDPFSHDLTQYRLPQAVKSASLSESFDFSVGYYYSDIHSSM